MYILFPKLLQQVHAHDADLSAVFNHSLPCSFIMIPFCALKTSSGFSFPYSVFSSPVSSVFHDISTAVLSEETRNLL